RGARGEAPAGPWWSVGAFVTVSGLAAGLAARQRCEAWAFIAGLLLQLAAAVVVLHFQAIGTVDAGWVHLVQANTVVAAVVAFAWLACARAFYGAARPDLFAAPLLAVQVLLPLLGNVALLAGPLALLVAEPGNLSPLVPQAGHIGGWLALVLALAAAATYAGRAVVHGAV